MQRNSFFVHPFATSVIASIRCEIVDVARLVCCQHKRDGRNAVRSQARTVQQHVHKGATRPPIAIRKRMNRFELSVRYRRHGNRRQRRRVAELSEVFHQPWDILRPGRYVGGANRVDIVAANPVLNRAQHSAFILKVRPLEQGRIYSANVIHRNRVASPDVIHRVAHGGDICHDRGLHAIESMRHAQLVKRLKFKHPAGIHLQPLNTRGSQRLRAQQQARQRFCISQKTRLLVEQQHGRLRLRYGRYRLGCQHDIEPCQLVGQKRMVCPALCLSPVHSPPAGLPII